MDLMLKLYTRLKITDQINVKYVYSFIIYKYTKYYLLALKIVHGINVWEIEHLVFSFWRIKNTTRKGKLDVIAYSKWTLNKNVSLNYIFIQIQSFVYQIELLKSCFKTKYSI